MIKNALPNIVWSLKAPPLPRIEVSSKSQDGRREYSVSDFTLRIYKQGASGPAIEAIRTTYRQAVEEKDYEGFSPEYDGQFDPAATYFSVRDAGTLVATARIPTCEQVLEMTYTAISSVFADQTSFCHGPRSF